MPENSVQITARKWFDRLAPYRRASNGRAAFELILTIGLFAAVNAVLYMGVLAGQYWVLLGLPIASLLVVRLFIIQHDCGHNSFLSTKKLNDNLGRALGVLTFTPYDHWRRDHALHHAFSGNLEQRGTGGDIMTLTVEEYQALSPFKQLRYRVYRHPFLLFALAPAYLYLLQQRMPMGNWTRKMPWVSTMGTNIAMIAFYGLVIALVGWKAFLIVQIPMICLGGSIGIWLFYVQHQFDETHWSRKPEWTREHSALYGSSYYVLPQPLMWFTGNIGVHHVHHLSARVPFYNLQKTLRAFPELKTMNRLGFFESFRCTRLALWDEAKGQLLSFREARALAAA